MKFYIATSLSRAQDHNTIRDTLIALGHEITYDWTTHGDKPKFASLSALTHVALVEIEGVATADILVVLLPGGGGTHVELGVALSKGIQVIIHSEDPTLFQLGKQTKAFYHHPLVTQVVTSLAHPEPILEAFSHLVETASI